MSRLLRAYPAAALPGRRQAAPRIEWAELWADIVAFDPEQITDKGLPWVRPVGVGRHAVRTIPEVEGYLINYVECVVLSPDDECRLATA